MARPRRRTRPARGEGRRALLEAVVRVVARQGLDALTYRAVAQEAGVTHGLVSYHFGSRDAMIDEALHYAIEEATRESRIGEEAALIEDFAASLPELVDEHADAQAFQHQLHHETGRSAAIRDGVLSLRHDYLEIVRSSLERLGLGGDEALARLVLAALDGLVMQQLVFREPALTAEAVLRLQHLLVIARDHGLGEMTQPQAEADAA